MGGCCSSPVGSGHSQYGVVKGVPTYDSAQSASDKHPNGSPATAKQQHNGKPLQSQVQRKKKLKRVANTDLATGELIPDFGVHGVFDVLYELGSGGSGRTFLCRDMQTGKVVAVKFVPRPLARSAIPFMMAEVEIQAELGEGCLNIISLHEIVLTKTHLALVLEYASGGSLTEEVSCLWESALQRGGLFMQEQEASYYMRQFVHALAYCHKHKVAHRDLKLDNTLLEHCIVGPPRLKLCDFGFAKRWTNPQATMHTAIGTPVYMSPQMLAAKQCSSGYSGLKADMWAAGILMFVMLLGTFPFDHDMNTDPNSSEAANEVWLKQQQQGWRRHPRAADVLNRRVLSAECCDLLDKLLEMDEDKRITTAEVLQHPWLHIPLNAEQQTAWQCLQDERTELDRHLQQAHAPRVVKLRKEAMFAVMAMAAKAPGQQLIPGPASISTANSASLHDSGSSVVRSDAVNSTAGVPTAPAAPTGTATPLQSAFAAAASAPIPDDVLPAPGNGLREEVQHLSIIEGSARSWSLEQRVAADRQHTEDIRAARMAAELAAIGEHTEAAAAAAAAAAAGGNQMGQLSSATSSSENNESHHSEKSRSNSRREIISNIRGTPSPPAAAAAAAGAANFTPCCHAVPLHTADAAAPGGKAATTVGSVIKTGQAAATSNGGSKAAGAKSKKRSVLKSAFAPQARATSAAVATDDAESDSEDDGDEPDDVWRLPMTSTADPALFKLTPELSVAAGALIKQLQSSGHKVHGRGRASRGSCPMY